jgi:hypothetical protein
MVHKQRVSFSPALTGAKHSEVIRMNAFLANVHGWGCYPS